jgi:hypothetical protein
VMSATKNSGAMLLIRGMDDLPLVVHPLKITSKFAFAMVFQPSRTSGVIRIARDRGVPSSPSRRNSVLPQ